MADAALGLPELRRRLAAAVGHAARRLWRRFDLEFIDTVVLDLLTEALARIGHQYQPRSGRPARLALAAAPRHILDIVGMVLPLAGPPGAACVAPATPLQPRRPRPRSGTPPRGKRGARQEDASPLVTKDIVSVPTEAIQEDFEEEQRQRSGGTPPRGQRGEAASPLAPKDIVSVPTEAIQEDFEEEQRQLAELLAREPPRIHSVVEGIEVVLDFLEHKGWAIQYSPGEEHLPRGDVDLIIAALMEEDYVPADVVFFREAINAIHSQANKIGREPQSPILGVTASRCISSRRSSPAKLPPRFFRGIYGTVS